jgi:hypothetical protein
MSTRFEPGHHPVDERCVLISGQMLDELDARDDINRLRRCP